MIRETYQKFQSWQGEQNEVGDAKERCARNKKRMMAGPAKMWLDVSTAVLDIINKKLALLLTNLNSKESIKEFFIF